MSSPSPAFASSQFSITSPRRIAKSRFTYKQLHQLKTFSTQTPLRVIAHVDLDAFYAQCETVRRGLDPSQPLAVQQWGGLIAINYAARAFGLNRHVTSVEALKACPDIILQHVATWKEGDAKWAYHEDSFTEMATHKVSLDPYRRESKKILKCIKEFLPEKDQRVEKAGIDEVFLDLSAQVHTTLLERYPELRGPAPYDDPTERLPKVPTTVLDWATDALVETGEEDGEDRDPDWDDVCTVIASEIVRDLRKCIMDTLGYTCSGGIAKNKMLSKLGSGYKKPNQQTVVRNRAVQHFLAGMKFTKIRMLGGKLGDEAVAMFGTDKVSDLLQQPLEQLKKLGDDTGSWLYGTIRGEDNSEVNPRTQIKSMLSAKSFSRNINTFEQGVRWLRIFAADIFSRCVEEGVLENKRRPKTINLHHRHQNRQTRSRQAPIPQGKSLTEDILFDLAKNLLAQIVVDGRAWPCNNLSLSVGGFEDGITGNKGIGGFLVRGEEAKAMSSTSTGRPGDEPPAKRRRTKGNIANFFGPRDGKKADFDKARAVLLKSHSESTRDEAQDDMEHEYNHPFPECGEDEDAGPSSDLHRQDANPASSTEDAPPSAQPRSHSHSHSHSHSPRPAYQQSPTPHPQSLPRKPPRRNEPDLAHAKSSSPSHSPPHHRPPTPPLKPPAIPTFFCPRCNIHLPAPDRPEHVDYHFALDLSKEMRQEERNVQELVRGKVVVQKSRGRGRPPGSGKGASAGGGGSASGSGGGGGLSSVEKGQARLAFGRGD